MRTRAVLAIVAAITAWSLPGGAWASQTVKLRAGFNPDRLGTGTTIMIGFTIGAPSGELPSPLMDVDLRLPAGVVFGSSTLGLATCNSAMLAERGLGGCSPDSLMGRGSALVGIRLGPEVLYERAHVALLMAPLTSGHTSILFYAVGASPVIAQLMFPSVLLGDSGPFGGRLDTSIPVIAALPGGPDAALVRLTSSIGPDGLTYYRRVRGTLVGYVPQGFRVPSNCPVGGFPFAANFTFQDGTNERATTTAPCPGHTGRSRH